MTVLNNLPVQIDVEKEVIIHSGIIEHGGAATKLWYLLRALDSEGVGHVTIEINDVCNALNIKKSSFYSYTNLKKNIFFSNVVKHEDKKGVWTIFLKSFKKVAANIYVKGKENLGLSSKEIGACAYVLIKDLAPIGSSRHKVNNLKIMAAEMTAQSLQHQSEHLANKELKELQSEDRKHKKILPLDQGKVFPKSSEISNTGAKACGSQPKKFFIEANIQKHGVSQQTIANKLNRSKRTIQSRLNSSHSQIERVNLYYNNEEALELWEEYQANLLLGEGDKEGFFNRFIQRPNYKGKMTVYAQGCNFYNDLYTLVSCKRRKYEASQYAKTLQLQSSNISTPTQTDLHLDPSNVEPVEIIEPLNEAESTNSQLSYQQYKIVHIGWINSKDCGEAYHMLPQASKERIHKLINQNLHTATKNSKINKKARQLFPKLLKKDHSLCDMPFAKLMEFLQHFINTGHSKPTVESIYSKITSLIKKELISLSLNKLKALIPHNPNHPLIYKMFNLIQHAETNNQKIPALQGLR
jgi:hypothetical protein